MLFPISRTGMSVITGHHPALSGNRPEISPSLSRVSRQLVACLDIDRTGFFVDDGPLATNLPEYARRRNQQIGDLAVNPLSSFDSPRR